MKKKYRIIPLLLAAVMSLTACSKTKKTDEEATAADVVVTPVEVMKAVPDSINKKLTYVGKVAANDTVKVTSKLSGQVKEVYVNVGDTVKKGQTLLLIDDKDIRDQISTSEAQLRIAEAGVNSARTSLDQVNNGGQTATQKVVLETAVKNAKTNVENSLISMQNSQNSFNDIEKKYNDYKTMLAAGVITQNDFNAIELGYTQAKNALEQTQLAYNTANTALEQAQASLDLYNNKTLEDSAASARNGVNTAEASRDSAAAALEVLKSNLNYIRVTSPIDGVITERNIEPTNMVSSAMSPFVVADTSKVTVDVQVSEKIINLINVGMRIDVNVNSVYDHPVVGVIKTIDPAAGNNGSFVVKIEINNADGKLKPGMVAHVSFTEQESDNVVIVPRNTVIEEDDAYYVFVADGNTAKKVNVTTGIDDGKNIEISGVEFGENIVVSGQNYISDGSAISITEPGEEAVTSSEAASSDNKEE